MKGFVEHKGCLTRLDYDADQKIFAAAAVEHPFPFGLRTEEPPACGQVPKATGKTASAP